MNEGTVRNSFIYHLKLDSDYNNVYPFRNNTHKYCSPFMLHVLLHSNIDSVHTAYLFIYSVSQRISELVTVTSRPRRALNLNVWQTGTFFIYNNTQMVQEM